MSSQNRSNVEDVLLSIKEVISAQQNVGQEHEPTPTEFFAIILSLLCNGQAKNLRQYLEILDAIILQASVPVVRSQFKIFSAVLIKIAKSNAENPAVIRLAVGVLGKAMRLEDCSEGNWNSVNSLQAVNTLLFYIDDPRVRLRKTVHEQIVALLILHKKHKCKSVRSYVLEFCMEVMRSCNRSEYKRSLYLLIFLEMAATGLVDSDFPRLYTQILRLQLCEQPILTVGVFRMIDSMFQSPSFSLNGTQCHGCVTELLDMKPTSTDMESNTYYCTALAGGLIALQKQDSALCCNLLYRTIATLIDQCESNFVQIHCAVGAALKRVLSLASPTVGAGGCISQNIIEESLKAKQMNKSNTILQKVLVCLESIFQLRYQHAWLYTLDALRSGLFDSLSGDVRGPLLHPMLSKIGDIYESVDNQTLAVGPGISVALSDTLGAGLRSVGVTQFLTVLPFRLPHKQTPPYFAIDPSKEWLLNIVKSNLKLMPCKLSDFIGVILPMARNARQGLLAAETSITDQLSENAAAIAHAKIVQIWSLFGEYCHTVPTDLGAITLNQLQKALVAGIKDDKYPELLLMISNALTKLIDGARSRYAVANSTVKHPVLLALGDQSSIFLPLLLALLDSLDVSDHRFQPLVQCVAAFMSVTPEKLVVAVSKKLLKNLLSTSSSSDTSDEAAGWMMVVLAVMPHLPENMIQLLYRTVRPLLSIDESISLQKRAYRVLYSLLVHHADVLHTCESRLDILGVIRSSLLTCNVSARRMRLSCMEALLSSMSAEELMTAGDAVIGEVLICQKDANKKSRFGALNVLRILVQKIPSQHLLSQLCSAAIGETTIMRASAISALCMLLLEHRNDETVQQYAVQLLPAFSVLMAQECVEQSRAILSFIRVCCGILPPSILVDSLAVIVDAVFVQTASLKSKFTSRFRAILRKLSHKVPEAALREVIPAKDVPLLDYIIKQARRTHRKKATQGVNEDEENETYEAMMGSDSDGEVDEDPTPKPRRFDQQCTIGDAIDDNVRMMDTRFPNRAKAMAVDTSTNLIQLPETLDDLLEDQPSSFFVSSEAKATSSKGKRRRDHNEESGATQVQDETEDNEYAVNVTSEGVVVVSQKEQKDEEVAPAAEETVGDDGNMGSGPGGMAMKETGGETKKKPRVRAPGEEYKAKKAGGDVWKKGQLEPHAYIPLDARLLSKKNTKNAIEHFGAVINNEVEGGRGLTGNRKQRQNAKVQKFKRAVNAENAAKQREESRRTGKGRRKF